MGDKIKVGKLDVDSNQSIAVKFGISSIPTLVIFKDGKVFNTIVGVTSKDKIIEKLSL